MAVSLDILGYNEQEAEVSTDSTSFTPLVTTSFNMDNAENVIVACCASMRLDAVTSTIKLQLDVDGDILWDLTVTPDSVAERFPYACIRQKNLSSGLHSATLQYCTGGGAGEIVFGKYARILVFRDAASAQSQIFSDQEIVQYYET